MRTYLNVPYAEKDAAKRLGARWNPERKQWYVENASDIGKFMRWMPSHLSKPHSPLVGESQPKKKWKTPIEDCGCCLPWEVCDHSFEWAKEDEMEIVRQAQEAIG